MDTLTFDSDHLVDPETMAPDTVLVCPLSHVQATVATARVSHLVTLINGETVIETPETIGHERHLRLAMNDIAEPREGLVVPSEDHVAKLIEFAVDECRQLFPGDSRHDNPQSSRGRSRLSIASRARKIRERTVPTGHSIVVAISS